jgi:hypothetical protein
MAGWAAAAAGVGTAAGAAATGDVDPAFEMLTDGGGAGEVGEEGEELIFNLRKNRMATAGDGKRLLVVAEMHGRSTTIYYSRRRVALAAAAATSRRFDAGGD